MSRLAARLERATRAALERRHPLDQLTRLHARTRGIADETDAALALADPDAFEALDQATGTAWPALSAYADQWTDVELPDAPRASAAWVAVHLPCPAPEAIAEARRVLDLPEPADVTERAMWCVMRMWARYALAMAE